MRTYLRDLSSVLSGLAVPLRDFFRWNAAKALIAAWALGATLALCLPAAAALFFLAASVAAKVSAADLNALASQADPAALRDAFFGIVAAVGPWPLVGVLACLGWVVAALAFVSGYAYQVLYLGALSRAAQGAGFPVLSNLWWSGLALRKYLATFSWWTLWAGLSAAALAVVDVVFKELLGRIGWADPIATVTPYGVLHGAMSYGLALWLTVRFGFAPLFLLADLRAARSGWSYVAESWRFSSGRAFWRLAARWVPCMVLLALAPSLLGLALGILGSWLVPAAALLLVPVAALRGEGPRVRRWSLSLAAAAAFCLAFALAAAAVNVFQLGVFGAAIATAYLPPAAAVVAGFAFMGLDAAPLVALWRRERARA